MPILLLLPAMMLCDTMTALAQVAMQSFPVIPDPAAARRRAFKVIRGGQQVVLEGAEGARYRHPKEP